MTRQSSPNSEYTWSFRDIHGQIVFIKDGQDTPTTDLDFGRRVTITLKEESAENSKWIPLEVTTITTFTVNSVRDLLEINKDLVLNKTNITVSVLDYFDHQ